MLRQHFFLIKRLFFKYPLNSFISISGLSLGVAGFLILALYVYDEYKTDKFHSNYEDIYLIDRIHYVNGQRIFRFPLPAGFKNDLDKYPGITLNTRALSVAKAALQIRNHKFYDKSGVFIDKEWLDIFDFSYANNNFNFTTDPGKIAISQELVDKYFTDEDPVGEVIMINDESYVIDNIILPSKTNSSINVSFLISYTKQKSLGVDLDSYTAGFTPYWVIAKNTDQQQLEQDLQNLFEDRSGEDKIKVTPFKVYYFTGDRYYDQSGDRFRGNAHYYNNFIWVALLILTLVIINYVNLSTARATDRAKEIGIKKTIGVNKSTLIIQFLGESFIVVFIATLLGVGLFELFIPYFNNLLIRPIDNSYLVSPEFSILLFSLVVLVSLVAGLYPAIVLSSFKPVLILKGRTESRKGKNWIRNTLITCQFATAILLTFSILVMKEQMTFLTDFDLGVDSEQIILIKATDESREKFDLLRAEWMTQPGVMEVSRGDLPGAGWVYGAEINGKTATTFIHRVDENFLRTSGIQLAEGRNFTSEVDRDKVIFNKRLRDLYFGDNETRFGQIDSTTFLIGVVEDFQLYSAGQQVFPLRIEYQSGDYENILIRVEKGLKMRSTLDNIHASFSKIATDDIFDYRFLDEEYDNAFKAETLFIRLIEYFTGFSLVISCIGLFGLAQFSFLKRTRELGIRKILGAPFVSIVRLIIVELFKPIILASFIGLFLGYYLLNDWLLEYANRIELNWQYGLLTLGIIGSIALGTIAYQLINSFKLKPLEVLKEE